MKSTVTAKVIEILKEIFFDMVFPKGWRLIMALDSFSKFKNFLENLASMAQTFVARKQRR
jgi:hypothetical protein